MSERILGALIGIHGDNNGLIMPPEVAPIQVVIVPIIFKGKENEIFDKCDLISKKLEDENIRTHVDKRDITPGNKYFNWELKGVPLRIEIGPREIEKKELVVVRRDAGKKIPIPYESSVNFIKKELKDITLCLFTNAKKFLDENMHSVKTVEEAIDKKGIIALPWCLNENCAQEIENILDGNTLGEPIEGAECKYPCPVCGETAKTWMRFAKTY
jgi:prolyl-tRNA synthetase